MKIWCCMAQMSVNELITWRNNCVQHVIWVEEVWDIGCQGLGNTLGLKTLDAVVTKKSKYSKAGCLINLCYFLNNALSSISNLVLYWAGNNILSRVDFIQLGINLQYIST